MNETIKYTVFKTQWGYFGLLANEKGVIRACLPCTDRKTVEKNLLGGLEGAEFDKNLLKALQGKIIAYFEGSGVKFDSHLALDNLPTFTKKVLDACQRIPAGKTITYSELAAMIGNPRASRAVGNALAKNPIPLVIPCHRVIRTDGSIGNFSAPGGSSTKKKLLALESKR